MKWGKIDAQYRNKQTRENGTGNHRKLGAYGSFAQKNR